MQFIIAWEKFYFSLYCALIDREKLTLAVPMYCKSYKCKWVFVRVVTMFWHHMTDDSSVLNMQVYSCWMQTYMQSRMATLHHHCSIGLWYIRLCSLCSCNERKDTDQINPALIFALILCNILPLHHIRLQLVSVAIVHYSLEVRVLWMLNFTFLHPIAWTECETVKQLLQTIQALSDSWQNVGCIHTCEVLIEQLLCLFSFFYPDFK